MAKLNQIIAVQAGKKSQAKETLTEAYHKLKKPELMTGIVRTYQPRDEGGEPQPEAARADVDRLDLERRLAGVVDAEEGAAVRLAHPARLGDAAHEQPAARVECQHQRADKPPAPEREARPLVLAVDLLDLRSHDGAAEHQLREEELTSERAKLAAGVVE